MARIRSIHPGMRTDEDYMALSFAARCCLSGVWIEADDHGVFKWKPKTLKAQIFPGDNVDMDALLGELETHNWVRRFKIDGEDYGICRNFTKWQRPKNPSYQHPFPEELRKYAGFKQDDSGIDTEVLPQSSPSPTEKAPQREEGGGNRKEDTGSHDLEEAVQAYNDLAGSLGWPKCEKLSPQRAAKLRARMADCKGLDGWYQALARAKASKFLRGETGRGAGHENWKPNIDFFLAEAKFLKLIEGGYSDSTAPAVVLTAPTLPSKTDEDWRAAVRRFKRDEYWPMTGYGPQPGYGGCIVPHSILIEFGLAQGAA